MWVNNLPKVATQWNSGTTQELNSGPWVRISSALTTKSLSHTTLSDVRCQNVWAWVRVFLYISDYQHSWWIKAVCIQRFSGKKYFAEQFVRIVDRRRRIKILLKSTHLWRRWLAARKTWAPRQARPVIIDRYAFAVHPWYIVSSRLAFLLGCRAGCSIAALALSLRLQ